MRSSIARPGVLRRLVVGTLVLGAWLLVTAMPVAADGGPHVALDNSGIASLTADGCAGCHRAHTAQGEGLLVSAQADLCLTCHGDTGTGATTNVEGGVQYESQNDGTGTGAVAGALRSGGFVKARIDSAHSSRKSYPAYMPELVTTFSSKVGVLTTGDAVTSAHLDIDGSGGVVAKGTAWGNGDYSVSANPGPTVDLQCASCHNPHGNGQYRILVPIPSPTGTGFVAASDPAVVDDLLPVPSGSGAAATRNYTIQNGHTLQDVIDANLGATAGDYWRRWIPWDLVPGWDGTDQTPAPDGSHAGDVPMYVPGASDNLNGFRSQITLWCITCHSRYLAQSTTATTNPNPDAIYRYQHVANGTVECTQCHVAHGSNADMTGDFSGPMAYPGGTPATSSTSGSTSTYFNSRLLKIDNRGTCQACHDPTGTIPWDGSVITH